MAAPAPEPQEKVNLSWKERLTLIDTLNRLPLSQFLVIETALAVPADVLPGLDAPQGQRSAALMRWLEGSSGPGNLGPLLDVLNEIGIQVFGRSASQMKRNDTATRTLKVKLEGDFNELDREQLKKLLMAFQELAQDFNVEMNRVSPGSIDIELKGTASSLRRIKELIDSHEFDSIAGLAGLGTGDIISITKVIGLDLGEADLRRADLIRADLAMANLRGALLIGANLIEANLRGADLREANLYGANLRGADLRRVNLHRADLSEAILVGADLIGTNLREANLREATLSGADLREADFSGANVEKAFFANSSGLTPDTKLNLLLRGAIFQDFPGPDVRSYGLRS
ncbi:MULTISPECIES: pentapeptide repeat-containing protein [Cyanophyceae]|uniref:Pentapeptide repeat-containing protein n=1 Tax=Leptolyngbya subtilissima DQ-A4 TaxID=2933933 RepID=A0ABV0KC05_9CYAN|nr:pentapeptide repeat-containing protein [Nodosilinea sp. FACHB-141]MBD2115247.1 pentapeptide repeat-containing protein [Nodosilinea sp. FACHB-141]